MTSSEDDEEDADIEDFLAKKQANLKKAGQVRGGVSAEAYGKFNKKEEYIPKVIEKSEEQRERIR